MRAPIKCRPPPAPVARALQCRALPCLAAARGAPPFNLRDARRSPPPSLPFPTCPSHPSPLAHFLPKGPVSLTYNTINPYAAGATYGIFLTPGKSATGGAEQGWPSDVTIANNIIGGDSSFSSAGVLLNSVGPKSTGAVPTISVTSNLIQPTLATSATKIVLQNSKSSPSGTVSVTASYNAFLPSTPTANSPNKLGPSSTTVTGYTCSPKSTDCLESWPWLTSYANVATGTGFVAQAGFGSANADPHFTGFDVSSDACRCAVLI